MNDGWMYQGRQQHAWFGHGTKPRDTPEKDGVHPGSLPERIAALVHTLVAGLPASQRGHAVARLDRDDRARLGRVMAATVTALPLGARQIATAVYGAHPSAPGVTELVQSAQFLKAAQTGTDLRAATDALADGAMAIGLDRFRPFLKQADEHLAAQGGEAALVRRVAQAVKADAPAPPDPGPVVVDPGAGAWAALVAVA